MYHDAVGVGYFTRARVGVFLLLFALFRIRYWLI